MFHHELSEARDPERVVLLGAGGFIGRALSAALEDRRVDVLALGRTELDIDATDAAPRLAAQLRPTDAVVFLAAITPDKGRGRQAFFANVHMAEVICDAITAAGVAQAVYFSSDAVYPFIESPVTEESSADPADLYGMMHRARELLIEDAAPGRTAVLRPTLVYGAADTHNSYGPNRLRRAARDDGKITLFGDGEERRDHILVDDLTAITLAVLAHRSHGLLNVATGKSVSYHELAERVAGVHGSPVEIVCTPRQNPVTHRHFDVTALHTAFPTFVFTPLEEGLAKAHREEVS